MNMLENIHELQLSLWNNFISHVTTT